MTRTNKAFPYILLAILMVGCLPELTREEAVEGVTMVSSEIYGIVTDAEVDKECQDGGQVQVYPTISLDSAKVEFMFSQCTSDDLSVDGELTFNLSQKGVGLTAEIDGSLTFSGTIIGTCYVDAYAELAVLSGFEYSGNICSYQSSELANALVEPILDAIIAVLGV